MNHELIALAKSRNLDDDRYFMLRLAFGIACVNRARVLIEDEQVTQALDTADRFTKGNCDREEFDRVVDACAAIASSHQGSNSIDGSGHAAVSATFAAARALQGFAWTAANYAAYAQVYAYSGYAVGDPSSFDNEYRWQVAQLTVAIDKLNVS